MDKHRWDFYAILIQEINKQLLTLKRTTMRHNRLKISVVLMLVLGMTGLQAQTSVNATGRSATGSGGSVSYSVGQVMYQTHTGTDGSVAIGVQQPYEISAVTGVEHEAITLAISAYPNPTVDNITLHVDVSTELNIHTMSYQLRDISGKLLQSEKIAGSQTNIVMSDLLPAVYFVRVLERKNEVKVFKIIKT